MSGTLMNREPVTGDYDLIASAVMETERGRWFLSEYARRHRHAETETVLAAIERLTAVVSRSTPVPPTEPTRDDIAPPQIWPEEAARMLASVDAMRHALRALSPATPTGLQAPDILEELAGDLDRSTSDILARAEQVRDLAWTIREQGADTGLCDRLELNANAILACCSRQRLGSARTRHVTATLDELERNLRALKPAAEEILVVDQDLRKPRPDELEVFPHSGEADLDFVMAAPAPVATAMERATEAPMPVLDGADDILFLAPRGPLAPPPPIPKPLLVVPAAPEPALDRMDLQQKTTLFS
jgi:hypothetical protein